MGGSRQWQEESRDALASSALTAAEEVEVIHSSLDMYLGHTSAVFAWICLFPFPQPHQEHQGQVLPPCALGSHHPAPSSTWLPPPSTQQRCQTQLHKQDIHGFAERGLQLRWGQPSSPSQHTWSCRRLLWHSPILPPVAPVSGDATSCSVCTVLLSGAHSNEVACDEQQQNCITGL